MARINTNVPALTSLAQLRRNNLDLNTRLERLSTGLRINRGKDDPAGLIASETLRNEIRAIDQAIDNSNRAINVISTTEGALNEVSSLLLDLRGLLLSSSNSGGLTQPEIEANQLEIDSLLQSIDRIANTTSFGNKKLLNGDLGYFLSSVDQNALASVETFSARVPQGGSQSVVLQVTASAETAQLVFTGAALPSATTFELAGSKGVEILSFASGSTIAQIATGVNQNASVTGVSAVVSGTSLVLNSTEFGSDQFVRIKALQGDFIALNGETQIDSGVDVTALANGQITDSRGLRIDIRTVGLDARLFLDSTFAQATSSTTYNIVGGGARFQITPQITVAGEVNIGMNSVSTANLGNSVIGFLSTIRSGGNNSISSQRFIQGEAIVNEAIQQVAKARGRLGGLQKNQIETNINSQQVQFENVTASESSIRDADLADEISKLTRAQILVQSTQLTLGIANQQPQAVLQLLG